MIAIKVTKNGLTVDGHAGYAKAGNDIICAAVSVLAQGLIHSLDALTEDEIIIQYQRRAHRYKLQGFIRTRNASGRFFFYCRERHSKDLRQKLRTDYGRRRALSGEMEDKHEKHEHEKKILDNEPAGICRRRSAVTPEMKVMRATMMIQMATMTMMTIQKGKRRNSPRRM